MIATMLLLNRFDVKALKITDTYSLHRVVYSLFDDIRSEQEKGLGKSSGILFADKGADSTRQNRKILILSDREPQEQSFGQLSSHHVPEDFLDCKHYRFEILINPVKRSKTSRKLEPVKGRESVRNWFIAKAPKSWGFNVDELTLQVNGITVKRFTAKNQEVVLGAASIQGFLTVIDRKKFIKSFQQGIGRGRTFGMGLLQIVPCVSSTKKGDLNE